MGRRGDFRPKDGGNDSANLNGLGRMEARPSLCEIFRNDSISKIVGEGSTKESFEWRFYGRATSLFDIETSRTSTKVVVRGEKHLCPVGCWTKRISSPRDEADVNLRNRVTEKYLIINSYPPIFNSSPAAERAIVPSLAHFFFPTNRRCLNTSSYTKQIFAKSDRVSFEDPLNYPAKYSWINVNR